MTFVRSIISITVAALPLLAGCTEILRAEFDLDPGSALESGMLPGPPPGDSVVVSGDVTANDGSVSLHHGSPGPLTRVDFITGGKPHNTVAYEISFDGMTTIIEKTPVMAIDAIDEDGRVACGLEIAGGEFRLVGRDGREDIGDYSPIDYHHVRMRIDKQQGRCMVLITQFAQSDTPDEIPTSPMIIDSVPLLDAAFDELDIVRFAWEQVVPGYATQYFLRDVVARKQDPSR